MNLNEKAQAYLQKKKVPELFEVRSKGRGSKHLYSPLAIEPTHWAIISPARKSHLVLGRVSSKF